MLDYQSFLTRDHGKEACELCGLGAAVLRLGSAHLWRSWIQRRWESVEFIDESTVDRFVRLDLDLIKAKELLGEKVPLWRGQMLVPLAMPEKAPHRTFTLIDEAGARLPRFNKAEGKELMSHGMIAVAKYLLSSRGLTNLPQWERWQARLVGLIDVSPTSASDASQTDESGNALLLMRKDLDESKKVLQRLRRVSQQTTSLGYLLSQDDFYALLIDLIERFYLLVPLDFPPAGRRVITYSYQEYLEPRLKAASILKRTSAMLSGPAYNFRLEVPAVGQADSFHIEVKAPYDLELTDSHLDIEFASRSAGPTRFLDDDNLPSRAHIYCSIDKVARRSYFTATFRSVGSGLIRSSFVTSTFILLVLAAALTAICAGSLSQRDSGVTTEIERDAATALLLLVPGVIATYLAQPSKHNLTSKVFYKTRFLIGISSVMSYTGALLIATRVAGSPLIVGWTLLTGISALCWLLIAYKWVTNHRRITKRDREKAAVRTQSTSRII